MKKIQLLLGLLFCCSIVFSQSKIDKNREINYHIIEAKSALISGDIQKAISLYNTCILADESCAVAYYELANIAIYVNDLDVALERSRKAVEIAPDNFWYQIQLAEIMEARGMLNQAAEAYFDLAKLKKQSLLYLDKSVRLYERAENWAKAIEVYEIIDEQEPEKFFPFARKLQLYYILGKEKEAVKELKKRIKSYPENSNNYMLLAFYNKTKGNKSKARKLYEKVEELDSITGISKLFLVRYYVEEKNIPKAYNFLKDVIADKELNEESKVAEVLNLLKEDTSSNINVYRDTLSDLLITHYPENAVGYLLKAQGYDEKNLLDKKQEMLDKALAIDPSNYNGLLQLCITKNIKKEWDSLYEVAKKGIEYYPQEFLFYVFKGLSAAQKKEYLVAEGALMSGYLYAKESKEQEEIKEILADVYYKRGEKLKAFDLFEELLAKNPENITILNNYAYFLAVEKKDLGKAEEMSVKTLEKEPDNPTFWDTYAWILYQQQRYGEALKIMEQAFKNMKEEPSADMHEHYGDILFKLEQKEQAIKEWQKALELPDANEDTLREKIEKN